MAGMVELPPLPTLLSQVLVAFTIEFDNEFEHRMPHRTSNHGATTPGGPLLVSLAMWANCTRLLPPEGLTVGQLQVLTRASTNLDGMRRWGYVTIDSASVIRPTAAGLRAREVWRPLPDVIERRWRERFGEGEVDRLRENLLVIDGQLSATLPDFLPILGYGLLSIDRGPKTDLVVATPSSPDASSALPARLARVLLAFAIVFERESTVSLAISANLLRVLDEEPVRVRDLPALSGVSKEAISMATGYLEKNRLITAEPVAAPGRGRQVRLTGNGVAAERLYRKLLSIIEDRWEARFGPDVVGSLRDSLGLLVGRPGAGPSPLLAGLTPYPDGWRAAVRAPALLPHYPMVLHRGGFPDGS